MSTKNPVVHFELPADDKRRAMEFYQQAFGWEAKMLGKEMGEYVVVTTADSDPKDPTSRPVEPGVINGGIYQRPGGDTMSQHPSVVISVDDIEESMRKVVAAGGKVQGSPDDIPGVGKYVSFIDTEGNRLSILQPNPMR